MLVYGALLGGMEQIALQNISNLNSILNEELFYENPELTVYFESYSAMEIHVLVRFGRWSQILEMDFPKNGTLMFFRTATLLCTCFGICATRLHKRRKSRGSII